MRIVTPMSDLVERSVRTSENSSSSYLRIKTAKIIMSVTKSYIIYQGYELLISSQKTVITGCNLCIVKNYNSSIFLNLYH